MKCKNEDGLFLEPEDIVQFSQRLVVGVEIHDEIAKLRVLFCKLDRHNAIHLILDGGIFAQDRGKDGALLSADIDGGHVRKMRFQGHRAADIHRRQDVLALRQDVFQVGLAGAVPVPCVHRGLKKFPAFAHLAEGVDGNVIIPIVFLHSSGVFRRIADEFFKLIGALQQGGSQFRFPTAGPTNQHDDPRFVGNGRGVSA